MRGRRNAYRSVARRLREAGASWFDADASWLDADFLPDYARDLNLVEAVWSRTKHVDFAIHVADDLCDLGDAAGESFCSQHRSLRVKRSYLKTAQLPID